MYVRGMFYPSLEDVVEDEILVKLVDELKGKLIVLPKGDQHLLYICI